MRPVYSTWTLAAVAVLVAVAAVGQGRVLRRGLEVLEGWGGYRTRMETVSRRLDRIRDQLPASGPIAFRTEVHEHTCARDRDSLHGYAVMQYLLAPRIVAWATADDSIAILETCDTLLVWRRR
jgi:hypothetical protein